VLQLLLRQPPEEVSQGGVDRAVTLADPEVQRPATGLLHPAHAVRALDLQPPLPVAVQHAGLEADLDEGGVAGGERP